MEWSSQDVLTLVLGLSAIVATLWAAWRWGSRRPNLVVTAATVSLMRPHEGASGLEMTLKGKPVQHPHVTTVTLWSKGLSDITPAHFETGDPIHLRFPGSTVLTVTDSELKYTIVEDPLEAVSQDDAGTTASVELLPQHLPIRRLPSITVVTDGEPSETQFVGTLLNVKISNGPPPTSLWFYVTCLGLMMAAIVLTLLWFMPSMAAVLIAGLVGSVLMSVLIGAQIATHSSVLPLDDEGASQVALRDR